jgi:diaminopimelate decarboxylase
MLDLARYPLERLADRVGTPFYLYDADVLRSNLRQLAKLVHSPHLAARYAMKANSARSVLETVHAAGLWIDAVSGNEVARALKAGFPGGTDPPVIMLTTDVFRDNALEVVREHRVLPSVGSPRMVEELAACGYRGPIAIRPNPGFGHGHVQACDTGGPSSKHGIWPDDLPAVRRRAESAGLRVVTLNVHVGTGPEAGEFVRNMQRVAAFFAEMLPEFPEVDAVNFGGGLPHPYHPGSPAYDLATYRPILLEARDRLAHAADHPVRLEIEPGRYLVAGMGILVTRVRDLKRTRANAKGTGHTFIMVDAGFCDLVRPAMYGAYHHIDVVSTGAVQNGPEPCVVAGPLCESGDVFTRDAGEFLAPRLLPLPEPGDLLVLQDAGAYGASMSSNYVSMGRVPQVWWDEGHPRLIARRETVEDITSTECDVGL